MRKTKMDKYNK